MVALVSLGLSMPILSAAHAGVCDTRAAQVARQMNGQVLSAVSQGNSCRIQILVSTGNGPPKRQTVVVRK